MQAIWSVEVAGEADFYRVLGIDPKDVGITPTAIITRTAVALALFVAIGVGAYCGCFAVLACMTRYIESSSGLSNKGRSLTFLAQPGPQSCG